MAAGAKPSATTISDHPFFQLTTDVFIMERGPRYKAYADLRESKLRLKSMPNPPPPLPPRSTPPEFQSKLPANRRKGSSVLTQSVPDFSSALRKENRRPAALPTVAEKSATPPAKSSSRLYEINARLMGSKSSVSGEKKGGGMRKSYANMDELKKFSLADANAINGENRAGRIAGNRGGGGRTTVLGCRQYY
ncbi:hypothetical protein L6452_40919 [Arctium lappa]|uniref:Uncharacterized protein n=1 Tax=Arctium lappa TaxID=4217 RepID=A0ACB8XS86_ARCLA|nr:hypothetical protein L6452_40919 [Arctium lappa]